MVKGKCFHHSHWQHMHMWTKYCILYSIILYKVWVPRTPTLGQVDIFQRNCREPVENPWWSMYGKNAAHNGEDPLCTIESEEELEELEIKRWSCSWEERVDGEKIFFFLTTYIFFNWQEIKLIFLHVKSVLPMMVEGSLSHNLYLNMAFSSYFPTCLFEERDWESSWVVARQPCSTHPTQLTWTLN